MELYKKVRIVAAGSGYTNATTTGIAIRGDGSSGVATVVTAGAVVTSVSITTAGSGYTTAWIANEDIPGFDNANQPADGTNVSANLEFVSQPKNGHGADPIEDLGAQLLKQAAIKTSDNAGDGTTTATVLASKIITEGFKAIESGAHPIELKKGIDSTVKNIVRSLEQSSKDVSTADEIKNIASSESIKLMEEMNKDFEIKATL